MKMCVQGFLFAAVLVTAALSAGLEASAAEGCAEKIIRARVAELGGYEVWSVKASEPGVLVALKNGDDPGVIMVGMASVAPDLVTYQAAWGRAGKSELSAAESAWLKRLFDKLYPDASFRECPEISRQTAPTSEQTFQALQVWWKDLNKVRAGGDSSGLWLNLLFVAVAVLFAGVVVLVFIIRKRRQSRGVVSGSVAAAKPLAEEPRAETPGDEPAQPDEPEEVL